MTASDHSERNRRQPMQETLKKFKDYLGTNHLKLTQQRLLIFKVFMSSDEKVTPEALLERVQEIDSGVSRSTIYRTVKHLSGAGVARYIHQGDGVTHYEPMSDHYSQMICERCGRAIPVINPFIDCLMQETARQQGFILYRYRTVMHGLCPRCQELIHPTS